MKRKAHTQKNTFNRTDIPLNLIRFEKNAPKKIETSSADTNITTS